MTRTSTACNSSVGETYV